MLILYVRRILRISACLLVDYKSFPVYRGNEIYKIIINSRGYRENVSTNIL